MNDQQAFARITSEATKEALLAKQQYEISSQRRRVEALREQVDDRLSDLANRVQRVKWDAGKYPHGAFGHDAQTLDEFLAALAGEEDRLADMEAADQATSRLTEKYQALVDQQEEEQPQQQGEPIVLGSGANGHGQYL